MKNKRMFQALCAAVATLSIAFASTAFACGPKLKKQAEPTQDAPAQQLKADADDEAEEKEAEEAEEKEEVADTEAKSTENGNGVKAEPTVAVKEASR